MTVALSSDFLTLEEYRALQDALASPMLMSALQKILAYEERYQHEGLRDAALADEIKVSQIVQRASHARSAAETLGMIRKRGEYLKPRAR